MVGLLLTRALALWNLQRWVKQPYAPTEIFADDPSLFYPPAGKWYTPQTIHEYLTLFDASTLTPTSYHFGVNSLDLLSIGRETWDFNFGVTQFTANGRLVQQFDGLFSVTFAPGTHLIERIIAQSVTDRIDATPSAVAWGTYAEMQGHGYWCRQLVERCPAEYLPYADYEACMADWTSRPWFSNHTECTERVLSGDSNACRVLHVESSKDRPQVHCRHAGPRSIYCNECMCGERATLAECSVRTTL